jgi:hypothetical protein
MLAPLDDPPQDLKQLFEDPLFFSKDQLLQQYLCIHVHRCFARGKCPD